MSEAPQPPPRVAESWRLRQDADGTWAVEYVGSWEVLGFYTREEAAQWLHFHRALLIHNGGKLGELRRHHQELERIDRDEMHARLVEPTGKPN